MRSSCCYLVAPKIVGQTIGNSNSDAIRCVDVSTWFPCYAHAILYAVL